MEHMNRECYFHTEAKTILIKSTSVMTKSFCSRNIEPNDERKRPKKITKSY